VPNRQLVFDLTMGLVQEACERASNKSGLNILGEILLEFWPTQVSLENEAFRDSLVALLVKLGVSVCSSDNLYSSALYACFGEYGCTALHDSFPEGDLSALELLNSTLAQGKKKIDNASSLAATSQQPSLRVHSATYNSSVASNGNGFEVSFLDVLRSKENAVVLVFLPSPPAALLHSGRLFDAAHQFALIAAFIFFR